VAVSLHLNERRVFQLHQNQPIAERMATLFGVEAKSIVEYDVEMGGVSFLVFLAHPDLARNDRTRICLFVNGRSVTSSTIIHAITAGYGEFLPGGRFPLAAVYITVDPRQLDVNVHPTKAEVRLSEDRAIHDNLYRIVKKALRDWRMVPGENTNGRPPFPSYGRGFQRPPEANREQHGSLSHHTDMFSQRPRSTPQYENMLSQPGMPEAYKTSGCDNTQPAVEAPAPTDISLESVHEEDIRFLGKTGRLYLLFAIGGELYVVDQHAAHERVLYEDALKQVEAGSGAAQKLLFPETVELSADEYLTFESSQEILNKLGFEIDPFGQNTVIVNSIPPVFRDSSPSRIMRKLLDDIAQLNKAGGEMIKSVAQSMACRASVMAGDRLTPEEAVNLLMRLFAKNNPYCCPHGRPTFIKISQEELDGRFGRT
jgi:DNA mismatch repair protein MutL